MKRTLLIADGDAELCDVYRRFLTGLGYDVETSSDGLGCVRKLHEMTPAASCWIWNFAGVEVTAYLPGCARRLPRTGFQSYLRPRLGIPRVPPNSSSPRCGLPSQAFRADCVAGEDTFCCRNRGLKGASHPASHSCVFGNFSSADTRKNYSWPSPRLS